MKKAGGSPAFFSSIALNLGFLSGLDGIACQNFFQAWQLFQHGLSASFN
jgi:hypothetical protein